MTTDRREALREVCPSCGSKGKPVKPITIKSLVVEEARVRAGRTDGFRFCDEPSCDVAYFHPEIGVRITRSEVRVRIGQKETDAPRAVCYCFDHTVEEIEADVVATGSSKVADRITAKCRQGLDRCEETNPQGSCCLGNVRRAIKEAQARRAGEAAAAGVASGAVEADICCAVDDAPATATHPDLRNTGLWATGGAVVSAILSSVCCWLPLLLIAFGASAAGVAGFFETYRPVLLGITGLLLAGGFYLVYFRQEKCGPGKTCTVPNPRLQRFNKVMLLVATTIVLTFALFPNYVGYFLGGGDPPAGAATPAAHASREFRIGGMTCEACAVTLREHLGRVPGLARAEVSFDEKTARLFFVAGEDAPSDETILAAIQQAGYSGTPGASSRTVRIAVSGMTCAGCASGLQAQLASLPGVDVATVDYDSARATVTLGPRGSIETVLRAVAEHGFEGTEIQDNGLRK